LNLFWSNTQNEVEFFASSQLKSINDLLVLEKQQKMEDSFLLVEAKTNFTTDNEKLDDIKYQVF
jgi:hypothetical protein